MQTFMTNIGNNHEANFDYDIGEWVGIYYER